jgi:hypothetical protein
VTSALTKSGVPGGVGHRVAASFGAGAGGVRSGSGQRPALVHDVQLAFAHSTQTVFYIMAGVMAVTFLVSIRWLPRGRVEEAAAQDVSDGTLQRSATSEFVSAGETTPSTDYP